MWGTKKPKRKFYGGGGAHLGRSLSLLKYKTKIGRIELLLGESKLGGKTNCVGADLMRSLPLKKYKIKKIDRTELLLIKSKTLKACVAVQIWGTVRFKIDGVNICH